MPFSRNTFLGLLYGDANNKVRRSLIHSVLNTRKFKWEMIRSGMMAEGDFITMSTQKGPLITKPNSCVRPKDRFFVHIKRNVGGSTAIYLRSVEVNLSLHETFLVWHGSLSKMFVLYEAEGNQVHDDTDEVVTPERVDDSVALMGWYMDRSKIHARHCV
jgi:hypothetical protein